MNHLAAIQFEKWPGYFDYIHLRTPGVRTPRLWMSWELLESQGLPKCLYCTYTVWQGYAQPLACLKPVNFRQKLTF